MSRHGNSGYIGVDKRTAKAGAYGLSKHILERMGGNFFGPLAQTKVTRQDDLIRWWKMDEGSGATTADQISSGATINRNDLAWQSGGKNGASLENGGGTSDAALSDSFDDFAGSPSAYSIGAWFYLNSISDLDWFLAVSTTSGGNTIFRLTYTTANGLLWEHDDGTGAQEHGISAPSTGSWFHYMMVWNHSGDAKLRPYLNGSAVGSGRSGIGSITSNVQSALTLAIFSDAYAGATTNTDAVIDDLRWYNAALEDSDVSKIYNSGNGDW
jgi:hypothetical protein